MLKEVFARVMEDWAELITQETDLPHPTPPGGAIERAVCLSGTGNYHLVLRVPREFGLIMGRIFNPGGDDVNPGDALGEVTSMYCGHLKDALWGSGASSAPFLPVESTPQHWPSPIPDLSCYLRIGAFPVEILFWDLSNSIST
jgi:hypothetical protein